MIFVILGTRAQLIKMAPILLELEKNNLTFKFILTGQHKDTIDILLEDFGIQTKPVYLYTGDEITGITQVPIWFVKCIRTFFLMKIEKYNSNATDNIFLVHGDTFSTILGAILAKFINAKVAHIEAGLRSFNYFHPFPEEITRILTFFLSDISFCPGNDAYNNMSKYKTTRVNTTFNTLIDSINLVPDISKKTSQSYAVCSIHRFENIFFKKKLKHIIYLLEIISKNIDIKFVLHPSTKKRLEKYKLIDRLYNNNSIEIHPRMSYTKFTKLLCSSSFVISDGGSNQEELYYMGIPTLLFRNTTERNEGLMSTTVITKFSASIINDFLNSYGKYKKANIIETNKHSPSKQIVQYLENLNYA